MSCRGSSVVTPGIANYVVSGFSLKNDAQCRDVFEVRKDWEIQVI
jgi:hypothetical protein